MQRLLLDRRPQALAALIALAGCAFSSTVPSGTPPSSVAASAHTGALLYVANGSAKHGVDILTFPQGKRIATIANIGSPRGVCADTSGHVYITTALHGATHALYAFSRGETTPLRTVRTKTLIGQCTVDPAGNVVVMADFVGSAGAFEIWTPSLRGKARVVEVSIFPQYGAYDAHGNLYLTGIGNSDPQFGVVRKGSASFTQLALQHNSFDYGAVGWDGTHVTLGTLTENDYKPIVARLTIAGKKAKAVSSVRLSGFTGLAPYVIEGNDIVAVRADGSIGVYDYPSGGRSKAVFSGFQTPQQLAISER